MSKPETTPALRTENKYSDLCDACASKVCAECGEALTLEDLEYCRQALNQESETSDTEREALAQELEHMASECQALAEEQAKLREERDMIAKVLDVKASELLNATSTT